MIHGPAVSERTVSRVEELIISSDRNRERNTCGGY